MLKGLFKDKLKIDIDSKKFPIKEFFDKYNSLKELVDMEILEIKRSKNNGFHVKIVLNDNIDDVEKILLQMFLCSDKNREFMNYLRYKAGAKMSQWSFLFDEKYI
ncbi:MAG: hypothetical protein J7L15_08840 [Clostridiales bacterium]|nr:hypothetical protein [Clostridiales bacterium]